MKKNTSVFRRVLDGLAPVATAFAFLLLASTASAAVIIDEITLSALTPTQTTYGVGDDLYIELAFMDPITSDEDGYDIDMSQVALKLNIKSGDASATRYAEMLGYIPSDNNEVGRIIFHYAVQPGDFVEELDVASMGFIFRLDPARPAAAIYVNHEKVDFATQMYTPTGADAGSLAGSADVKIQTIFFQDGTTEQTIPLTEAATEELVITRNGAVADVEQTFTITSSQPGAVSWTPATFTIPAGDRSAVLTLEGKVITTAQQTLTIHPTSYGNVTAGDLTVKFEVGQGAAPYIVLEGPSYPLPEGGASEQMTVYLSRDNDERVTVTFTSSDATKLAVGSASVTFQPGSGTTAKTIPLRPLDGAANVTITARASGYDDGTLDVQVSNEDPRFIYPATLEDAADDQMALTPGGVGTAYPFSWGVTDVPADQPKLQTMINFGDGATTEWITGTSGNVEHTYSSANTFTVTYTVRDSDGGFATSIRTVTIAPANTILINEYKRNDAGVNPYNGLQGLGRGTIDDNLDSTGRTPVDGTGCNWEIQISPTERQDRLVATPEDFEIVSGSTTNVYNSFFHVWITDGAATHPAENLTTPIAAAVTLVTLNEGGVPVARQIGGVFSREYYPEDNCADIDLDELPDLWEKEYNLVAAATANANGSAYPFESPNRMGNDDGDMLPAGAVNTQAETLVFPLNGNDYSPVGTAFGNVYEVRGIHHDLNGRMSEKDVTTNATATVYVFADPEATGALNDYATLDPTLADFEAYLVATSNNVVLAGIYNPDGTNTFSGVETDDSDVVTAVAIAVYGDQTIVLSPINIQDEPHYGHYEDDGTFVDEDTRNFFGTDPTKEDTDGDGLDDGWEYYWWYVATFNDAFAASIYDPTQVIAGTSTESWKVAEAFHPLLPTQTGKDDFDGDGLTNYEEMLLGTNPANWDTDGDTMNDGWEVMWGLNPHDPKDANGTGANPDGDWMAKDDDTGTLRHYEVYEAFGFDARTGWSATGGIVPYYYLRNRTASVPSPNTAMYVNYEEHYLGRWCIDMGMVGEVKPTTTDYMTQPVPAGWLRPAIGATSTTTSTASDGTNTTTTVSSSAGTTVLGTFIGTSEITTKGWDSDGDGMPDGWELYVCAYSFAIWPTGDGASADAPMDYDFDGVSNLGECHSIELVNYCQSLDDSLVYANMSGEIGWWNKFWPCDPWDSDTDGDALTDGEEGGAVLPNFIYASEFTWDNQGAYGGTTQLRGHIPGGGLNPNAVDTDMDFIPDFWEYEFCGETRDEEWAGGFTDGMDGTYFDSRSAPDEVVGYVEPGAAYTNLRIDPETGYGFRVTDFDDDGLDNYQEYFINGLYHYNYADWTPNQGYGNYDPLYFFNGTYKVFDWSCWANNWEEVELGNPFPEVYLYWCPPQLRYAPDGNGLVLGHASTDPRMFDSDEDGMDDFYELYHGLDPILSETYDYVGLAPIGSPPGTWDFTTAPWRAGMGNADPDQDGIPNFEERLAPNQAAAVNYHTDPSPMWFTDVSYENSFVNLYYGLGSIPMYWATLYFTDTNAGYPQWPVMTGLRPTYMYSFEVNEGYDTDNDNLPDKREVNATRGSFTDPLDADKPLGRKALYLDGNAAARTRNGCSFGVNYLRSWTVEAWVKAEAPASGERQIVVERPVAWQNGDTTPAYENVRRTFRLGIDFDGAPFAEFDNGGTEALTAHSKADNTFVAANEWCHLAATYDALHKRLSVFKDGVRVASTATAASPYTGFYGGVAYTTPDSYVVQYNDAPIVIGAADNNPNGAVDGTSVLYYNGGVFGPVAGQPALDKFFKGWVDEVRIWSGARDAADIASDFNVNRRYRHADVTALRNLAITNLTAILEARGFEAGIEGLSFDAAYDVFAEQIVRTGGETTAKVDIRDENDEIIRTIESKLPPVLLAVYNVDNLPDPNYEPVVPASYDALNGRPETYAGVPWWRQAADRSTVYRTYDAAPYLFPQWIENSVATLPLGVITNGVWEPTYSADSKLWNKYYTGRVGVEEGYVNSFPNTANPYGFSYRHGDARDTEHHPSTYSHTFFDANDAVLYNHLLPLRSAVADMSVQLWDDPAGTTYGVNADSDGDGLPDWWESQNGLDPDNAHEYGDEEIDAYNDFDGDGLSNYFEFLAGTDPWDTTTDSEKTDAYADSDGDGLSNADEAKIGTSPASIDTDDDGIPDMVEIDSGYSPTDSTDPLVLRYLHNDGEGYVSVPGAVPYKNVKGEWLNRYGERFDLEEWTLEATVRLTAVPADDIVLVQRNVAIDTRECVSYKLAIGTDLIPYVYFESNIGTPYKVKGYAPVPLNEWTHVAGRFGRGDDGDKDRNLVLFVNGSPVKRDVTDAFCATGYTAGDVILAKNLVGDIDEVRIWSYAMPAERISRVWNKNLLYGADSADMGSVDCANASKAIEIPDNDRLHLEQWTLEAWINTKSSSGVLIRRPGAGDDNYKLQLRDGRISAVYGVHCPGIYLEHCGSHSNGTHAVVYGNTEIAGSTPVNDGRWHHVAFALDGNMATLYVDGERENSADYPPSAIDWHDKTPGHRHDFDAIDDGPGTLRVGENFDGLVDEVRVFNFGRTSQQIRRTMYNQINPIAEEGVGLLVYLTFDNVDLSEEEIEPVNTGVLGGTTTVVLPASVRIENFLRGSDKESVSCNAPVEFNTLAILGDKLAAYFPFEDGRYLPNDGVYAVEDFKHRQIGIGDPDNALNEYFAGSLSDTGHIDFMTYQGFSIADCSDPMFYPTNLSVCDPASPFRSFPLPDGCPWRMDSDGDGMPDVFEIYYGLNPNSKEPRETREWPDGDFDGDGLSNYYEYLAGTDPTFWSSVLDGVADGDIDTDDDGLSNRDEQMHGTNPGRADTDDDGFTDLEEYRGWDGYHGPEMTNLASTASSPLWSNDPIDRYYLHTDTHGTRDDSRFRFKSMKLDGKSHEIPRPMTDRNRFNNEAWTIEAFVYLTDADATGSLIRYDAEAWTNGVKEKVTCYELGVENAVPYVMFQGAALRQELKVASLGAIPLNTWVHLAGVFDPARRTLELYEDGVCLSAVQTLETSFAATMTTVAIPGHAYIGDEGLFGNIDEVRIWSVARTASQIEFGANHLVQLYEPGLVADFRFDDGGESAEDFAHRLSRWNLEETRLYFLTEEHGGFTPDLFDTENAVYRFITEFDDGDGDGLPDAWEERCPMADIEHFFHATPSDLGSDVSSTLINISGSDSGSFSAAYLGWKVGPTPFYSTEGHRWITSPDAVYLFRDFMLSEDQAEAAATYLEIRMAATEESATSLYVNGKEIPLTTQGIVVEGRSIFNPIKPAGIPDAAQNVTIVYYIPGEVMTNTTLLAGRNRIAVKVVNTTDTDYRSNPPSLIEYFNLEMRANGNEYLIRRGGDLGIADIWDNRWWYWGHVASMAEPPADSQGRSWYDADYCIDHGEDPDKDGLPNWFESFLGTNPLDADTDGDGIRDCDEDDDYDGLTNLQEYQCGTHPMLSDTDDDGVLDGEEISNGTDPLDAHSPFVARAVSFNGKAASRVVSPANAHYSVNGSFTLNALVKPAAYPSGVATIVSHEIESGVFDYRVTLDSAGKVHFVFTPAQRHWAAVEVVSPKAIPLNGWTRITAGFDEFDHRVALLVNGEEVATRDTENIPAAYTVGAARPVVIGEGFSGLIRSLSMTVSADGTETGAPKTRFDFRMDDGSSYAATGGAYGSTDWPFAQLEDFADVEGKYERGTWQYRLYERTAAAFEGSAAIVALGADGYNLPKTLGYADTDADSLPDWWEFATGYDPYAADDPWNDADIDGLSSWHEYVAGLNPWDEDTDADKLVDYEDSSSASARMNGVKYTDNDYLADAWEAQWRDIFASPAIYDEHWDKDGDGWDNWSEHVYQYVDGGSNVVQGTVIDYAWEEDPAHEEGAIDGWWEWDVAQRRYVWNQSGAAAVVASTESVSNDTANATHTFSMAPDLVDETFYPRPTLQVLLDYVGRRDQKMKQWDHDAGSDEWTLSYKEDLRLVVLAYTDPQMNGKPDAIFNRTIHNAGTWPIRIDLTKEDLVYGHVRQGKNYFFAFVNMDGTQDDEVGEDNNPWYAWRPNDPAAVADGNDKGIDIGIDKNVVRFSLSDDAGPFARFSWQDQAELLKDRKITITTAGDLVLFEKTIKWPRSWLHEGDIIAGKTADFGLGTGSMVPSDLYPNAMYWYLDGTRMGMITNYFAATMDSPKLVYPNNAVLYEARPVFRFRLDPEATEFTFTLRRGSATGTAIYTDRILAPGRTRYDATNYDLVEWQFPYSVGDYLPSGSLFTANDQAYYWQVTGYRPTATASSTTSATASFRMATTIPKDTSGAVVNRGRFYQTDNGNLHDKGVIYVNVRYPGMAAFSNDKTPYIRVQAFESKSFNGRPEAEVTVTSTGVVVVAGLDLTPGEYYIRAFVDQDGNFERAIWESWGYLRAEGTALPFVPVKATASVLGNAPVVDVTIRDADTDGDNLPDAMEYALYDGASGWLSKSGPGERISSPGYTDYDGDGLNDLAELEYGTYPWNPDTNGDGVDDFTARQLGFAYGEQHSLVISSASFVDGELVVNWEWTGVKPNTSLQPAAATSGVATLSNRATYVIEATDSLSNPNWEEVSIDATNLSAGSFLLNEASADHPQRFFRIRVIDVENPAAE